MRRLLLAILFVIVPLEAQNSRGKLIGAGATFPAPLYQHWIDTFGRKFPDLHCSYMPVGSGKGVEMLRKGAVDFAASDMPLTLTELNALPGGVVQIPTVVGAVVPVYHIENLPDQIRFTPETLAGIYLGKIKRWDDPLLKQANRGVPLPARNIVVIHRSDPSGTSYVWSDYLSKVSVEWKTTVGKGEVVSWPVGQGAVGNGAVSEVVAKTPDSIGYVEGMYALQQRLSYGSVRNAAGAFVEANLATVSEAAKGARAGDSFTDAPGLRAYPIASFTYLLVPVRLPGEEEQKALNDFVEWLLTKGQKQAGAFGFAGLPPEVDAQAVADFHGASSQAHALR